MSAIEGAEARVEAWVTRALVESPSLMLLDDVRDVLAEIKAVRRRAANLEIMLRRLVRSVNSGTGQSGVVRQAEGLLRQVGVGTVLALRQAQE